MALHCFLPPVAAPAQTLAAQWMSPQMPQAAPSQGPALASGLVIGLGDQGHRTSIAVQDTHLLCWGLCTWAAACKSHLLSGQSSPRYRLQTPFSEHGSSTRISLLPLIMAYFYN